jgi:hypothetical protein
MPSRSRLPVAALLAAALAAHGDEAVRSDGTRLTGRLTLAETGRFRFRAGVSDEPLAGLDLVRFTPKVPAAPPVPLWHQVRLGHDQVLLAEIHKLDEKGLHVRPAWADTLVIPRTAVERVTHLPGWRPVLVDSFDSLAGWAKAGEPRAVDGRLVLDRSGQAVEANLRTPLAAGRVGVTFRSAVTTRRRVLLDLGFVRGGKPNAVRVELVGPGGEYTVAAEKPDRAVKLKREPGRRRLSVEWDNDRLAVFVDEFVLWVRDAGPGELRSIKFVGEGDGTEAAGIDDVAVLAAVPVAEPRAWADLTADAVRSPDGDETFGTLSAVGPAGVTLDLKGKKLTLGWPDVAEFTFRCGSVTEKPTTGEHVRVRVRTAEGRRDELDGAVKAFDDRALVLVHPVLGELSLPRDRVEEVRFLFHGRRVPVDSVPHHLGARPAFGFAVPRPEGLRLAKTFPLDRPAAGFVVVDAAQVSGAGTPAEVRVNGEAVGELNRFAGRPQPVVRTYRLPVAGLQRGDNEVEVRLRPAAGGKVTGVDVRAVRLELADPR